MIQFAAKSLRLIQTFFVSTKTIYVFNVKYKYIIRKKPEIMGICEQDGKYFCWSKPE